MTDYEFIMEQCRKYQFTAWDASVLRDCQSILPNLTREELVNIYRNRKLGEKHPLKQTAFKVLFADKIGRREERIKMMDTNALIEEFRDKKSGNVALSRKELRERYITGRDKALITTVFNNATKIDKQWVKSQERKEKFGDGNRRTL